MMQDKDILKTLISAEEIAARVKELGAEISKDYEGKTPVVICILKGSIVFMADLIRAMDLYTELDFMVVSSFEGGVVSTGAVKLIKDIYIPLENRDVIIVEDILDSGKTLSYICKLLEARKPNSIKICTLLDKPSRRVADIKADYVGFEVPDEFVVGCGLDYDEKYRNLPYVGVLKPSVYSKEHAEALGLEV